MKRSIKKQTLHLTMVNGIVRFLGMVMRVVLSRMMGAEIMGITELAQSVHMLAITPLTSGLPLAVSRLTAKASAADRTRALEAGVSIVRMVALCMIPLMFLLSPLLARSTGDMRVLPSLWFSAPCILILGYSAVYNGYCYGTEQSGLPAWSELIEQTARLVIACGLLFTLRRLSAPWLAAVPVFSTMTAEIIGLFFVIGMLKLPKADTHDLKKWTKPILQLAVPATAARFAATLLRALESIILPARLIISGLDQHEALSRLGMLNGMVMPLTMLPCIFTSALSMVLVPRIAKAESRPKELKRLIFLCFLCCAAAGFLSWGALCITAPVFAGFIFRLPELTEWIRLAAPLALLFPFAHVTGGILASLGQQKLSMLGSIPVSALTLGLTWLLCADPALRQKGVIIAQGAGQIILLLWNISVLIKWFREKNTDYSL